MYGPAFEEGIVVFAAYIPFGLGHVIDLLYLDEAPFVFSPAELGLVPL